MSNLNQFVGQGNLVADPRLFNADVDMDRAVVRFAVAINTGFGDNKRTTFMECVGFGKQAGVIAEHLTKGKQVIVRGQIIPNVYEPEDGEKRTRLELELERVNGFFFTGNAGGSIAASAEATTEVEAPVEAAAAAGSEGEGKLF